MNLITIGKLEGLGQSFLSEQTLSFEDSPYLFKNAINKDWNDFINYLYDFSNEHLWGVTKSYIKFHSNVDVPEDVRERLASKGWEVIR